ncbi:myb/SANT-like DNA-binding domain-containing protein 2 isoform X5 [Hyperolius riggenbachi]|uniref:myb/SANT-like DNA-binding domain-containing protein 2 isoform X5 n=1 Tax=Hyperolius riggenbachi TaxID=752182 RepID=UPI0035A3112F
MAAPCNSELPSEASSCLKIPKNELMSPASPGLKIPKNELMSPASPGLSDGNRSVSNPSTPNCSSPLTAGAGLPAPSYSTAACRGMSWTPAETNALIAVWGNERLVEARYQQLEGAGTIFGTKSPGPAMYDRVSRALAELGYERTPSQCRERMKTLRRCYSRVKERGFGKRKSSYTFEQLERVFGQGGWDTQPCQPVLINSSGLYQEMESDGSTMEDYSLEDWGNQSQEIQGFPGEELDAWLLHTRNVRASISPSICADLTLALLEVHVEQKFVTTVQGQSITLPIWYSSSSDFRPYVSWYIKREQSEQEPIITYMDGAISVYPAFTGRLNFAHPMPSKNVSITINRTLASDTGEYRCYILVHGEPIEGSSSIGVIDVSILVPPSKPTCQLQGDSYIGANVTLICRSSTGQPKPTYSWIKKAASKLVFFSPAQDSVKGTLTLTNISRDNSGTYVCISKNTAGVTECNINMQVTSASRVAIIVGAVVGSIVGLCWVAILIAVFIYLYRRQKKEAQDETENDIREDAAAPKSLTWTKANGSDLGFKNGTLSSLNSNQKPYPPKSPSDTTSINTATGSTTAFRPPYITDRGRVTTPTPSMTSQSLPTYMAPSNGNYYTTAVPASGGGAAPKPNEVEHRAPRKELNITSGVTPSNLVRMGAVPVMVPAQSQAGSLV